MGRDKKRTMGTIWPSQTRKMTSEAQGSAAAVGEVAAHHRLGFESGIHSGGAVYYAFDSLAMLADTVHNLSDVASIAMAYKIEGIKSASDRNRYTFGKTNRGLAVSSTARFYLHCAICDL